MLAYFFQFAPGDTLAGTTPYSLAYKISEMLAVPHAHQVNVN